MQASLNCPKCGAEMDVRPLTAADGTPLGFAGGDSSGDLMSLVCPNCSYAELRAVPDASGDSGPAPAPSAEPDQPGIGSLILLAVSAFFATTGVIWIHMASGPVMEAGGFVASGGPYVIAHQAEDWIWLLTLGATVMSFAVITNFFVASGLSRPAAVNLLVFWTGLFGLNSYQFFKYGINAPGGGRSWTWIMLGVMFAVFAVPTLLVLFVPKVWRGFDGSYAWANAIGVISGVVGGLWIWSIVAGCGRRATRAGAPTDLEVGAGFSASVVLVPLPEPPEDD